MTSGNSFTSSPVSVIEGIRASAQTNTHKQNSFQSTIPLASSQGSLNGGNSPAALDFARWACMASSFFFASFFLFSSVLFQNVLDTTPHHAHHCQRGLTTASNLFRVNSTGSASRAYRGIERQPGRESSKKTEGLDAQRSGGTQHAATEFTCTARLPSMINGCSRPRCATRWFLRNSVMRKLSPSKLSANISGWKPINRCIGISTRLTIEAFSGS